MSRVLSMCNAWRYYQCASHIVQHAWHYCGGVVLSMCACYSIVNIQCMAMLCLGYYWCAMCGGIINVHHTLCNTGAIIMVWYYQWAPIVLLWCNTRGIILVVWYYQCALHSIIMVALLWCGIINVQHALYYCGTRRIVLLSWWCGIISLEAPYRC